MKEVLAALGIFEVKIQKKITRKVLRFGAKIMREEVLKRVPVREGLLKSSIVVRAAKRSRKSIGVNVCTGTQSAFRGSAYYGGILEYGSETKDGKTKISPRKFLRDSYEAKKQQCLNVMIDKLEELVAEVIAEVKVQ